MTDAVLEGHRGLGIDDRSGDSKVPPSISYMPKLLSIVFEFEKWSVVCWLLKYRHHLSVYIFWYNQHCFVKYTCCRTIPCSCLLLSVAGTHSTIEKVSTVGSQLQTFLNFSAAKIFYYIFAVLLPFFTGVPCNGLSLCTLQTECTLLQKNFLQKFPSPAGIRDATLPGPEEVLLSIWCKKVRYRYPGSGYIFNVGTFFSLITFQIEGTTLLKSVTHACTML